MWDVREEFELPIQWGVAKNEYAAIQIPLSEEKSCHPVEPVDNAKQFEIEYGVFKRSPGCDRRPYAGGKVQEIVIPLQAENPQRHAACVVDPWDVRQRGKEEKHNCIDPGKFLNR